MEGTACPDHVISLPDDQYGIIQAVIDQKLIKAIVLWTVIFVGTGQFRGIELLAVLLLPAGILPDQLPGDPFIGGFMIVYFQPAVPEFFFGMG